MEYNAKNISKIKLSKVIFLLLSLVVILNGCSKKSNNLSNQDSEIIIETKQLEEIIKDSQDSGSLNSDKSKSENSASKSSSSKNSASKNSNNANNVDKKYYIDTHDFLVKAINKTDNTPLVLLTIDDCVQPETYSYSLDMAKTLKKHGVGAIFFVNGKYLETDFGKTTLKEISEMGFEIGNHTYAHLNLSELDYEGTRAEIVRVNDQVEEITGRRPKYFRSGYGVIGDYGLKVVEEENMIWTNWTYGYDWEEEYREAGSLAKIMTDNPYLQNGANLLMHDHQWTSEALSSIITGLQEKGYHIVDPAELTSQP